MAVFQAVRRDRKRAVLGTLAAITLLAALGIAISESPEQEPAASASEKPQGAHDEANERPSASTQGAQAGGIQTGEAASPPAQAAGTNGATAHGADEGPEPASAEAPDALTETSTPVADSPDPAARRPTPRPRRPAPARETEGGEDLGKSGSKKPKLADSPYVTPKSPD